MNPLPGDPSPEPVWPGVPPGTSRQGPGVRGVHRTAPWPKTLALGLILLMVGLGLGLGDPAPALGEAAPNSALPRGGDSEVTVGTIPSEKVTQFVTAYLQVVALIDARSEELEAAPTEAESLALQQAIQASAYQVIEATGLTRQEYWQLLGLANGDMEFRDRVLAQLEEFP